MQSRTLRFLNSLSQTTRTKTVSARRLAKRRTGQRTNLSCEALEARRVLASYVVDTVDDVVAEDGMVSLREAIQAANQNVAINNDVVAGDAGPAVVDTISFADGLSLFTLGEQISITDSVAIANTGDSPVTISGNHASRIFSVDVNADATVDNTVSLTGLTLSDGFADSGGAIFVASGQTLSLDTVTLSDNTAFGSGASQGGGAIFNDGGTVSIVDSTISDNVAAGATTVTLSGSEEVPPVTTTATGEATFVFDPEANTFDIDIFVDGLEVPGDGTAVPDVTGVHLHVGAAGTEGGVIVNLGEDNFVTEGTGIRLRLQDIGFPPENVAALLSEGVYINVHSSDNLGGEVRGQVVFPTTMGSGGGIFNNQGSLTISDSSVSGNVASRAGGGIETAGGDIELTAVNLNGNVAGPIGLATPGNGGGLHVTGDGEVTITRGTVNDNNAALEGGGLWNGSGTMSVSGTQIARNVASGDGADDGGGGIFNNGGTLNVTGASIESNQADGSAGSGGGILTTDGTVTLDMTTLNTNSANRAGGGIEVILGTVTLNNDTNLTSNDVNGLGSLATVPSPGNGGGLHVTGAANVTLNGGSVTGNEAGSEGGGLWNNAGTMTINGTLIDANVAESAGASGDAQGGGGIFNNGGTLVIADATISNNVALDADGSLTNDDGGGGLFNDGGTVTISDTDFDANLAMDQLGNGGGIFTLGGSVSITGGSFTSNEAARAGGAIENNSGNVTLTDVTVGGTTAEDGNSAGINGGGIHVSGMGITNVNDGTFRNNTAAREGGGLWNSGIGTMTVSGTVISDNSAVRGGGVYQQSANGSVPLELTLTNVAPDGGASDSGLFLTPVFNAFHDGTYDVFSVGETASAGLESLAEDGAVDTIAGEFTAAQATGVSAVLPGGGPLAPGQAVSGVVVLDPVSNRYHSYASMVIPSNDAFIGNDNPTMFALFDDDGNFSGPVDLTVPGSSVWDAGTEVNNEINAAFFDQMAPNTGTTDTANIAAHPGFLGSAGNPGGTPVILGGTQSVAMMRTFGVDNADFTADGYNLLRIQIQEVATGLSIDGVTIQNNTATGSEATDGGGGIYNDGSTVTVDGGSITGNVANGTAGSGGGVFNAGEFTADMTEISGNTANRAGGGIEATAGSTTTLTDVNLDDNVAGPTGSAAPGNGGGLHITGLGDATITGGTVSGNAAASEGGGLWNGFGVMTVSGTTLSMNNATGTDNTNGGGALFNNGGTLNITDAMITDNTTDGLRGGGAGVMNVAMGTLTISGTTLSGNTVAGTMMGDGGGAVLNIDSDVTITGSTLSGNTAFGTSGSGGAILSRAGSLTITDSTISGNSANRAGGAIELGRATVVLTNVTIGGDEASDGNSVAGAGANPGNGGGIHTTFESDVTITGGSIQNNSAIEGGGLWNSGIATMTVSGTVISDNTAVRGGGVYQETSNGVVPLQLTLTNVAPDGGPTDSGLFLTPVFNAFHDGTYDVFSVGETASAGLESLAEDGAVDTIAGEFTAAQATGVSAVLPGGGPLAPGQAVSGVVVLDPVSNRYHSYASMVIPSNDAFIGNDNPTMFALFDDDGNFSGPVDLTVPGSSVWDAGTEVNNEVNAAFFDQMAPNTGTTDTANIAAHPGFLGSAGNPGGTPVILGGTQSVAMMRTFGVDNADFTADGYNLLRIQIQEVATGLSIDGVTIQNNTATGSEATDGGGGIYNNGSTVMVDGGSITGNVADGTSGSGGGVFNAGEFTADMTEISGNTANRAGGGIEATAGSTTTLTDVNLDDNVAGPTGSAAPGNGGGLHITGLGDATITGGTVSNNDAALEGGGLWTGSGMMAVSGTTISGNTASGDAADDGGGGIFNNGGTLSVSGGTISGNTADGASGSGGGILNLGGDLTVTNSMITGNAANRAGGGIETTGGSTVSVDGSNIDNNTLVDATAAPGNGGGVHIGGNGAVTINGGTVSNNTAIEGGGLWNSGAGTLAIDGTTIDSNTAVAGGGVYNDTVAAGSIETFTLTFSELNGSGVTGTGSVTVDSPTETSRTVRVVIDAEGLQDLTAAGGIHVAHIHGQFAGNASRPVLEQGDGPFFDGAGGTSTNSTLPSVSADDGVTIEDGFLDFLEGRPKYGPVILNLTSTQLRDASSTSSNPPEGVPPLAHFLNLAGTGDIDPTTLFPSGTEFNLDTTYTFDLTNADEARQFNNLAPLNLREVVLHGQTIDKAISDAIDAAAMGTAPAGADQGDGTAFRVTAPVAAAEIVAVSGSVSITGATITGNTATGDAATDGGGGIHNENGSVTIANSTISGNTASGASGSGGGIINVGGTVSVSDSEISANTANRAGGGIETTAGSSITLTDVNLDSNSAGVGEGLAAAPGNGGGLHVSGDGTVTISGGTVNDNDAALEGGGLWNGSGFLSVLGTTISGNTASGDAADDGGGGVFNNGGTLSISGGTISGNTADGVSGSGGGILNLGGNLDVTGTMITGNTANRAGGGIESTAGSTTDLTSVNLDTNVAGPDGSAAPGNGGGLHITSDGDATITGGTVSGNTAASEGGGLWNGSGVMTVSGTTIDGNTASGDDADNGGGGIFNVGGTVSVSDSSIINNIADGASGSGGGVLNSGTATFTNTEISNNVTNRAGGGIEATAGSMTTLDQVELNANVAGPSGTAAPGNGVGLHISGDGVVVIDDSTIAGNEAANEGGGLWNSGSGSITVSTSTISTNTSGDGGGIFNDGTGGDISVTNSTIAGNTASAGGGGVATEGAAVTLTSVTIARNTAATGGGVSASGGVVTATNTIIASNLATSAPDVSGSLTSGGNNLIGDVLGATLVDSVSSDITGVDAGLGMLADNGGPTQTIALLNGSPALEAGVSAGLTVDQRGVDRPQGTAIDIGAFESALDGNQSPASLAITATDADKAEGDSGVTTFSFTVTRTDNRAEQTTVDFVVSATTNDGLNAADFDGGEFPSGTVTFAEGQAAQLINIEVAGDTMVETSESFTVTLTNASGDTQLGTATAIGTIQNDDVALVPLLSISPSQISRQEGDAGTTEFVYTVTQSGDTSVSTSVDFSVSGQGSDAANPDDFGGSFPTGTVDFAAGESSKPITVIVSGDNVVEPDESFIVTLNNATGDAMIVDGTSDGLILDDDFSIGQTSIFVPTLVARPHVIPGDNIPTAIVFQALSETTVTVTGVGSASVGETIQILDGNTNPISSVVNGVTTATVQAGGLYAIIFGAKEDNRIYSVRSSTGFEALSNSPPTNILQPTDTTGEGETTARDALVIINALGRLNAGEGEQAATASANAFLDVNRDGQVSARDALNVINALSRQASNPSEGELLAPIPDSSVNGRQDDVAVDQDSIDSVLSDQLIGSFADSAADVFLSDPDAALDASDIDEAIGEIDLEGLGITNNLSILADQI